MFSVSTRTPRIPTAAKSRSAIVGAALVLLVVVIVLVGARCGPML